MCRGFFAGYWNCLAWILGAGSMSAIAGKQDRCTCQVRKLSDPSSRQSLRSDVRCQPPSLRPTYLAHVFVAYILITWAGCLSVCFGNKILPHMNGVGIFFIRVGVFVTIIVFAVMPSRHGGPGHASSAFVWTEWIASIGYPNGFVFVAGMLNGAYAVGTPDCVAHLAEEIPRPENQRAQSYRPSNDPRLHHRFRLSCRYYVRHQ